MVTPRKVGILGGMGPEATVLLMQKIIQATPVKNDNDHIPMIVDNNPQVPSRIDALIHGKGESPGPVLAKMARSLEDAGAEVLIMPCNTAHHYADFINSSTSVPFLDMIFLTSKEIAALLPTGSKIGILASSAVRLTALFENALAKVGLQAIYATDDSILLATIQMIKADGPSQDALNVLNNVVEDLENAGAAGILIACTEFSLLSKSVLATVPILDSLEVIAQKTVDFSLAKYPAKKEVISQSLHRM
ncbi:MAG: amino acid racemase [Pseudomonadales bacterium]|nr:amino acid racemase [Pseudomonadales bacterium]NRA16666.1 amino acid racemase [Oceanospirillaceae bacterium]